jgi:hypothetical protein
MPNYSAKITGYAIGDDLLIRRTINRTLSNLPTGVNIDKAWMTVKIDDDDLDAAALIQKEITTSDVSGIGHIEDDGAGDTDPIVRFDMTDTDTRTIGITHRYYDIQVRTDTGAIYTGEIGVIFGAKDITLAIA